jgi:hypothetical protein
MFLRRKFSPGFFRTVNRLLRLPGVRHVTGALPTLDAATTMEKLDATLNNMSHGLCMFGRTMACCCGTIATRENIVGAR